MITVKLQGGCGNQMFQFAMGLSQAYRLNSYLALDIGGFVQDSMREYSLDLFPRIAFHRMSHRIGTANISSIPITIHENGMPYNQVLVDSLKDRDSLKGFWQSEKYFENYERDIRWFFQPAPLTIEQRAWFQKIVDSKNPTFLTIRRTDYVDNSFHGELPISYYEEALKVVNEETGTPDVFVFTDDIKWCKQNLNLPCKFQIAGTYDRTIKGHLGREDADLYLMSLCKNAVMANSSFSWWGAWLGDSVRRLDGGIVIAPKQWFGPASNEDSRDIVPDRWIKI